MNPSEDPNDRLLDSLLRESARGTADQSLLEDISNRLDRMPVRVKHRASIGLPWLAAAAALMVCGIAWTLWPREHGRIVAPVVETQAPVVTGELASRPEGGAVAPGPDVDASALPAPIEGQGDGQSTTLREFAGKGRTSDAGVGIRLRVLSFPADPALTEAYAHDPGAPEGTPGTRIEVRTDLSSGGRWLSPSGERLILCSRRERPESGMSTFGEVRIPHEATDGILVVFQGSAKKGENGGRVMFLDASPGEFPPGSVLMMNLSPAIIRLHLERDLHEFEPGERKLIPVVPVGANGLTAMGAFHLHGRREWRRFASGVWPNPGGSRALQIVWPNPESQSLQIRGIRDRVEPAVRLEGPKGDSDPLKDLVFLRQESTMWYVQFGLESQGTWAPRFLGVTHDKRKLQNRIAAGGMLRPGDVFFPWEPMAGRFKFIGIQERDIEGPRDGLVRPVKFAIYEDLLPGKAGRRYESQSGLPDAALDAEAYHDRTALFKFGEMEFRVEEHARFNLPGEGNRLEYLLKEVSAERVVIESEGSDGEAITREIRK